jgi:hypothetical protein
VFGWSLFVWVLQFLSPAPLPSLEETPAKIFCVVSPKPRTVGSQPNCDSILPLGLSNSWGSLSHDWEQQTFFLYCSSFTDWLAHLSKYSHGTVSSLYSPLSPLPPHTHPLPTDQLHPTPWPYFHFLQVSVIMLLAQNTAVWQKQVTNVDSQPQLHLAVSSSILLTWGWLPGAVLFEQK